MYETLITLRGFLILTSWLYWSNIHYLHMGSVSFIIPYNDEKYGFIRMAKLFKLSTRNQ